VIRAHTPGIARTAFYQRCPDLVLLAAAIRAAQS